jgi:hypothetical protein
MGRKPYESDFKVDVYEDKIAVLFWPTQSLYSFIRFTNERDLAEFGPVSPDPVVQHGSRSGGTRQFDAAEVLTMAFRLATEAARAGK